MTLLWALIGLAMGSLTNWARDYAPRFSKSPSPAVEPISQPSQLTLALGQLLKSFAWPGNPVQRQRTPWVDAAVELLMALLFAYLWSRFGPSWRLLSLAVGCCFFVLIAAIDLKYRLVLDVMIYPAAVVALLLHVVSPKRDILSALAGGALGFCVFLLTALVKRGALGGGDVKLAGLIGLVVGFPEVLWALALGIVAGGITALLLVLSPRWELKSHLPYAPFLCLGAMIALLYNPFALLLPQ